MSGGGQTSVSEQRAELPPELRPLVSRTGERVLQLQEDAPLSEFLGAQAARVPGLSQSQQRAFYSLAPALGAQPGQERTALSIATDLPEVAGRTPGGYAGFGGRAPMSEQRALSDVLRLPGIAGRTPTGEGLERAPTIQAQQRAFEALVAPQITSELTLSGLGRSTAVPQALALAQAQMLPGLFEAELGRQERGIQREAGAIEAGIPSLERLGGAETSRRLSELGAVERGIERTAGGLERALGAFERAGGAETGRRAAEFQATAGAGEVERGVVQEESAAEQAERLRRQALAEQALFLPFGQLVPSSIGQQATTRTSGGGLFK